MISSSKHVLAPTTAQAQFSSWNQIASCPTVPFPQNGQSPVTINFTSAGPIRCKVYQPMELRYKGVKVMPGPITCKLEAFNPKTPKMHTSISSKLESARMLVLMKLNSMGNIHLRFPVAGQWSLSVEYDGEVYTSLIEVHGQRGKLAKLQSRSAVDPVLVEDKIKEIEAPADDDKKQSPIGTPSAQIE